MVQKYVNLEDEMLVTGSYEYWLSVREYLNKEPHYYIAKIDDLYERFYNREKMSKLDNDILVALAEKLKNLNYYQMTIFFKNLAISTKYVENIYNIFENTLNFYYSICKYYYSANFNDKLLDELALKIYLEILQNKTLRDKDYGLHLMYAKIILKSIQHEDTKILPDTSKKLKTVLMYYGVDKTISKVIEDMVDATLYNRKLDLNLYNYLK